MSTAHRFPLAATAPQFNTACGWRTSVTADNFPLLDRLSLYRLCIREGCFREPHWHPNADELGYCLSGRALVTIFASGNVHAQFSVSGGEMFFVPSGSLHVVENIGSGDAEFVICFSHERVEDFGLSGFVGALTPGVMGNTWGLDAAALSGMVSTTGDLVLGRCAAPAVVPPAAGFPHPYKFPIEAREPLLANASGSAIVARRDTWPALRAQAMYSLRVRGDGMREPHWHPETAELGCVLKGHARMTVKSPGPGADTYELETGDIYFIPRGYPHHIENLRDDEMRFLIFFDTPDVQDIGLSGAVPACSPGVVGPTLGLRPDQVAAIPPLPADLLIVGKHNPVD